MTLEEEEEDEASSAALLATCGKDVNSDSVVIAVLPRRNDRRLETMMPMSMSMEVDDVDSKDEDDIDDTQRWQRRHSLLRGRGANARHEGSTDNTASSSSKEA